MNIETAQRNILQDLQQDPTHYRCFGVWWWPIKRLLRKTFGQEQLFLLGTYEDEDGASRVPQDLPAETLLSAALEEYNLNRRYNLGRNTVTDPEGEMYVLVDADAGGL